MVLIYLAKIGLCALVRVGTIIQMSTQLCLRFEAFFFPHKASTCASPLVLACFFYFYFFSGFPCACTTQGRTASTHLDPA